MDNQFEFMMYRSAEEDVSVNALIRDETIWLTQKAMGELFGVDKSTISRHLKNIFQEGELDEKVVVAEIATTTQHGAIAGKFPLCNCGTDGGRDCLHEGRQRKRTYGADNMEKCA
jgi:hypothetical protein